MPQLNELNPINLSKAQPPLTFAAANVRFLSQSTDGADDLWSADIKACRHGTAHIFGIEFEDGYPKGLNPALGAYLAVRESKLHIGVGDRNDAGEYELVPVEPESWIEAAGLSFDKLGKN